MAERQVITRKVQIYPVGDKEEVNRVYKFIRDGQYAQNRAYNILISSIYAAIISGKSTDEINMLYKRSQRNPKEDDPEYSLYKYGEFEFAKGLGTPSSVKMRVKADIKKAKTDGLFKGRISIPNKKLTAPLITESRFLQFRHGYESFPEFLDALYDEKPEVYLDFVNGITFKVIFGNLYKSQELRSVFQNIFEDNYQVLGSSMQFDKTGKKIMLNLSLSIPVKDIQLEEDAVVGVHLGSTTPAICTLNKNKRAVALIGNTEDFVHTRVKIQEQKRRLQSLLKYTKGGHGRKKKLAALEKYDAYEKNFAKTYNHYVSKNIVDFAVKHHAKYINIEEIEGKKTDAFALRNWSYYQLQTDIAYKAAMYGIEVRKVKVPKVAEDEVKDELAIGYDVALSLEFVA